MSLVLVVALTVGPSLLHGHGLLLAQDVQKDQPLAVALTPDCQLGNWSHLINHCSTNPTAYIGEDLWLRAKRDLEAPTELTVDYDLPFGFVTPRGSFCKLKPADVHFKSC